MKKLKHFADYMDIVTHSLTVVRKGFKFEGHANKQQFYTGWIPFIKALTKK